MTSARRLFVLILVAGAFVLDGYDLNSMALVAPRLKEALGLDPTHFGLVFGIVTIGVGAGAALLAPWGDKFGRRSLIVFGCLFLAFATAGTATATTIPEFVLWRLLTGFGLGICLPNCTALSAELAPPGARATVMTLVSAGISLAALLAGWTAPEVIAWGGWQAMFLLPAAFAALVALLVWLVLPGDLSKPVGLAGKELAKVPQLTLFRSPWLLPFAVFTGALLFNSLNLYMVNQWTPTLLPRAGFTIAEAQRQTGLQQGAGLVMGLAMSFLIDRWRPGTTMIGAFVLIAAAFIAIGVTEPDPTRWRWLLVLGAGIVSGAAMALPALTAFLFPPNMVASAVGMGVLIARIGAFAGPLIGQAMLTAGFSPAAFLMAAALPALIAAGICLAFPAALAVKRREEAAA
jgi:AAHS family 4-hydroxybenzoate transporter-like MFS transporter